MKLLISLIFILAFAVPKLAVAKSDEPKLSQPVAKVKSEKPKLPQSQSEKAKVEQTESPQPEAVLRIFDMSVKPHKEMNGNRLSRSRPRAICLYFFNVPIQDRNLLAQYVRAPGPIEIMIENAKLKQSNDKKEFLLVFDLMKEDIKNNTPYQCWTLGKNDPIGTYKLDVQFNGMVFKNLEFNLLK